MLLPQQRKAFSAFAHLEDDRHRVIRTLDEFWRAIGWLKQQKRVAGDTEGTGLRWYRDAHICGVSMSAKLDDHTNQNFYFPFAHSEPAERQLPKEAVMYGCREIFEDEGITKVFHNIKFDEHFFRKEGVRIRGPRRDTMISAHLYDENTKAALKSRVAIDLKNNNAHVAEALLDRELKRTARSMGIGVTLFKEMFGYDRLPTEIVGVYGSYDTDFTMQLDDHYEKAGIYRKYADIYSTEMKLTKVLHDLEQNGVDVDVEYLQRLNRETRVEMQRLAPQIHAAFNYTFEVGSDTQLLRALTHVGAPLWKRTKGGVLATDAEVLEELVAMPQLRTEIREGCKLILKYRAASKIESTYTSSVLEAIGHDGRVHGDYQQVGTKTGRLSARHPNMQNFQGDSDERALAYSGKKVEDGGIDPWSVKRAFTNRGGPNSQWCRLYFDYSQIELRVLARYSYDPKMMKAFIDGVDLHTQVSIEVFGNADKANRRLAKVINFGLSYCMSAAGFSRQTGVPREEAERHFNVFFQKFARVEGFRNELWGYARRHGCYVENMFGRPRRVPTLKSLDDFERARAERMLIGSYIQGTAAELTKISMVRIHEWEERNQTGLKLVSTIHDEISLDVPKVFARDVSRMCRREMVDFPMFHPVPIEIGGEYSTTNWSEKEDLPEHFMKADA